MPPIIKAPKNRQERIFALIRELGMTVAQKNTLVYNRYGKYHVCQLNREQGIDLESYLREQVSPDTPPISASALFTPRR
jgi:hypothetical protein